MVDSLTLKWGTLKAWELYSPKAIAALDAIAALGPRCVSVGLQEDSPEEKAALCNLIDAVDAEFIWSDWDGERMTKEEAKKYVMEYGCDG